MPASTLVVVVGEYRVPNLVSLIISSPFSNNKIRLFIQPFLQQGLACPLYRLEL